MTYHFSSLALKLTTLKKIYLSYSFKITQGSLPFDFCKQLEVPEKPNQNFALILISHHVDNVYSSTVQNILIKTTLKSQTLYHSSYPKTWDSSSITSLHPVITLFWFSLTAKSHLCPPLLLFRASPSLIWIPGGILMGFVLSAGYCHSKTILHSERMINLFEIVQSSNSLLKPFQFFSKDNSIKSLATCSLELIHLVSQVIYFSSWP